jgi:O-antigen/teichoic acid export membrane protein
MLFAKDIARFASVCCVIVLACFSSTNDNLLLFIGETKLALRIDALLLNVATPDVVGEVLAALVITFFNLSFEPGNRFELDMLSFFNASSTPLLQYLCHLLFIVIGLN